MKTIRKKIYKLSLNKREKIMKVNSHRFQCTIMRSKFKLRLRPLVFLSVLTRSCVEPGEAEAEGGRVGPL